MDIIIFGTGQLGGIFKKYCEVSKEFNVIAAVDNCCAAGKTFLWRGIKVENPVNINQYVFDKVVIAILKWKKAEEMKTQLLEMGISADKIVWLPESDALYARVSQISRYDEKDRRINWIKSFAKFVKDNKMAGNVAECGVNRGDCAMYINRFFAEKKLYLFDTFDGFSERDLMIERELANKDFLNGVFNLNEGFKNTSVDYVLNRMPIREQCIIRKGYFPESAAGLENEKFCFVNLDMDLYKPQLEGLRFFYDKLVVGG